MKILQPYLEYFSIFENLEGVDYQQQQPLAKSNISGRSFELHTPIKKEPSSEANGRVSKITPKLAKISAQNLSDGVIFHELLSRISGMPSIQINHKPQTFTHNFSNLKALYKNLQAFWQLKLEKELSCDEIDFVEIAKNSSEEDLQKFAELFVRTAIQAQNSEYFIEKIILTSEETQSYFFKIVDHTIGTRSTDSPRKQLQKRLYDKLMQMDHENTKLQHIIDVICNQKLQVEKKNKQLTEVIAEKDRNLMKLAEQLNQTPQKQKNSIEEEKLAEDVEKLKNRMIEMTKQHEKQMSAQRHQLQFFNSKMERLHQLQSALDQYRDKMVEAKAAISKSMDLQNTIRIHVGSLKEKDKQIDDLKQKIDISRQKIKELEERDFENRLDLQRKTVQLQQSLKLSSIKKASLYEEDFSMLQGLSIQRTLSEQCPEILGNQTDNLMEANRMLRAELQRSKKTITNLEAETSSQRSEIEKCRNLEKENKKLTMILKDMSQHRGQQNDILVGCLHEMRLAFGVEKKPLKQNIPSHENIYSMKKSTTNHERKALGRAFLN